MTWQGGGAACCFVTVPEAQLLLPLPLQLGAVFSATFCGQAGYLLACGGAMGSVTVWDMRLLKGATSRWPQLKTMGLQPEVLAQVAGDEDE